MIDTSKKLTHISALFTYSLEGYAGTIQTKRKIAASGLDCADEEDACEKDARTFGGR